MRRALVGIVPDELLNRKRKAFVARAPLAAISSDWASLTEMTEHLTSMAFGIIEPKSFSEALREAAQGMVVSIVPLIRALGIELWLRNSSHWNDPKGGASAGYGCTQRDTESARLEPWTAQSG